MRKQKASDIAAKVGNNLRYARKRAGLTQKQLAEELNKRQADYSNYETGRLELDYEKIVYLCKRLNVTPDDLFDF